MILALVVVGAVIWWFASPAVPDASSRQISPAEGAQGAGRGGDADAGGEESADDEEESADDDEPADGEEEPQTEEERLVDAFDALTDRWEEETGKDVSMDDIAAFTKAFKALPEDRQDECIHRALNLIPDENVMLLAGVLMDKTMDKEIVETVYNDILNRDEDVKKPILQQIFKDKTHPCWADTAWILDVTGELPKKN